MDRVWDHVVYRLSRHSRVVAQTNQNIIVEFIILFLNNHFLTVQLQKSIVHYSLAARSRTGYL